MLTTLSWQISRRVLEKIEKGCLLAHVVISTVTSSVRTMYALSVYFFSIALLLLAVLILFILHWRHEVVKARKRFISDNLDSAHSPLNEHLYTNCQLKNYDKLNEKARSVESFSEDSIPRDRYSYYDNNLSSEFVRNNGYVRRPNII